MSALVTAIWNGPFPAQMLDGQTLQPGDEYQVTEAELESGHWVRKPSASRSAAKSKTEGDS